MPTPNILQSILQALSPQQTPMDVGALRQNFVQQQGQQPPVPTAAGPVPGFPADIRGTPPSTSTPEALPAIGQPQPQDQPSGINIMDIIKRLAPTAIATGVGMGVPGALPGATGFATGFEGEKQRQATEKTKIDEAEKERIFKEKMLESKADKDAPTQFEIMQEARRSLDVSVRGDYNTPEEYKKAFDDEVKRLNEIVQRIKRKETPTEQAAKGQKQFSGEQESLINENIKAYNKPREEIIQALQDRGVL